MTNSLQEVFKQASALPEEQQEALAAIMKEEIEAEKQWEESIAKSPDALAKLAEEALEEHYRGETRDLDELL
jgi:VIT1/CCC1 family predicted Fe2+/Mn2+ transporter